MLWWERELTLMDDYAYLKIRATDYYDVHDLDNLGCIGEQLWAVKEGLA